MAQKLIIGTLALLIVGVMGYGIYSTAMPTDADVAGNEDALVEQQSVQNTQGIQAESEATTVPQLQQNGQNARAEVTSEPMVMAADNVGDVWTGIGTVTGLDDYGFTLELDDASSAYVELGPPDYWQSQAVTLADGDNVTVDGWDNGEQIHARVVTTANGELVLRSESSQPLWAGGANNAQGQNSTDGSTTAGESRFQVAPEDWVTISGTVSSVTNGSISMQTSDGTVYALQMGQPTFWQSQGVSLAVGDEIEVLGFWMNEQFTVGDITKIATGEHIILRDPNGRQLWAGPGRNGESNGNNGNGGNGNGGNGNNGNGNSGNGNGNGGNGNGNHGGQ